MRKYTLTARRLGLSAVITPLASLSNLILLPILTKNLAIADYGAWALIMATISLLPVLATLGLQNAMTRFLAAATNKRDIREAFYSMGFIVLLASLMISGLLFLFVPQIAADLFQNNNTIALLLIPNVLIACLTAYVLQYFVTFQQIKRGPRPRLFQRVPKYGPDSLFCPFGTRIGGRRDSTPNPAAGGVRRDNISHCRADWFGYPEV